jgi:aspartate-semialdehyde dehydrogenase
MVGYQVAVVGATGAAGEMTLRILEERKFPVKRLRAFASARSVGKAVSFAGESIPIEPVTDQAFRGIDVAFFSAGTSQSKEHAPLAVSAGAMVVDKSNAFRMDPAVPLVIPEINAHAVKGHRGIVANPNCTTVVTAMALAPLHRAARVRRVVATSYQAVSGAGVRGVEDLRQQTLAWARGEAVVPTFFSHQIAFNLIPHIDKFGDGGYTGEEWKLVNEVRKILEAPDLLISPTTVRVPVFTAHSVAVNVETEEKVTAARARELFERFPGLRVCDEPALNAYPMPITVEGQDDCVVGRIREDLASERGLNFWVVGDQLRKGAATNAVQIAELLVGLAPATA